MITSNKKNIDERLHQLIIDREQWDITSDLNVNINPETNFFIINKQGNKREVSRKECVNILNSIILNNNYCIFGSDSNVLMICATLYEADKIVSYLQYQYDILSKKQFKDYLNNITDKINSDEEFNFTVKLIQKFRTFDKIKIKEE